MKKNINLTLKATLPSITAVIAGLVLGWLLLFITNPVNSFGGLLTILTGGLTDGVGGIGNWLYAATPILMTGMAVGFSIKTGLFNIGASGQFTVGAFVAIYVGCTFTFLPPVIHSAVAILSGMIAGAFWGYISGAMKAYFKINEVISGIMLNYIAMLLVNLLVKKSIYNESLNRSSDVADSAMLRADLFDFILPGSKISIAFFIAVAAVLVIKFVLDKTTLGYELKITGKNPFASVYSGMKSTKNTIIAMSISGALAGLGGALMFLCDFGDHILVAENVLQQGFTGISVALLGMSNPVGIIAAALFIAHITIGGNYLQLYGYTPDVVNMIIAIIIFCGALVLPLRAILDRIFKKTEVQA